MYRYRNIVLVGLFLIMGTVSVFAQTDRHDVRKGNRDFKKEKYAEAQIDYSKALIKDTASFAANYNLGNTLYRMGDAEQALKSYSKLQEVAPFSPDGDKLLYNIGNASATVEDWQTAVDAYKASLLMNPGDIEAKENYIYAKSKLEEQENEDQNQNQDGGGGGDDNQDQNDDNQDQNQDQNGGGNDDQNQDQNQDQQNGGGDDERQNQDQQQGQGQPEISPQQAQQMLQAIQAKDNETLDRVNKEKAEVLKKKQREKNW